jgi:NTP pyrophosphatase (non-canonical NTP hydrolase)
MADYTNEFKSEHEEEITKKLHLEHLKELSRDRPSALGFPTAWQMVSKMAHYTARALGAWPPELADNELIVPTRMALIISEAVEALECHRRGKSKEELEGELADIVIRLMDLEKFLRLDVGTAIMDKLQRLNENLDHCEGKRY